MYLHVQQVLSKRLENQLYITVEKCEFHVTHIAFLEYVIGPKVATLKLL